MAFLKSMKLLASTACLSSLFMAGCASLGYSPGGTTLAEKSLVFGKILLVRDGEEGPIRTFSTPVKIGELLSTAEPLIVAQPFEADGRFLWALPPGQYILAITLHAPSDDQFLMAFTLPEAGHAYYFGDLYLTGEKHFSTIGGANIKNVKASFGDHFPNAVAELQRRDPALDPGSVGRLEVTDISAAPERRAYLHKQLDAAPTIDKPLAELPFEKLRPGKAETLEITGDQGVFEFPEGRSFFRAFALPEGSVPRIISLISHPFSAGIADSFRIFVPAALLLDENFAVVGSIPTALTHPVPATLFPPGPARLSGQIDLAPLSGRAKYLVLYTTGKLLAASPTATRSGALPIAGGAVPTGLPVLVELLPWITGKVTITVSEQ